eukprot:CAMPEP_0175077950 /NCGR_PEP_ID=MMETSP0052_2-20121109/23758_1 /TAXON_ID=51329 ORGANISM="Polytomella parva, Strain SAG 63-3" /NCGR_SAMPLE_ID=MMETSP0052_2 /ASSEMBLY_ACC=CAM_ASM_000194 /LENGTH=344 /DNA_ID=CAMNT_0016347639 /DNA_START=281 /DNA_END=1315 /DNA_ORIENTATION=-
MKSSLKEYIPGFLKRIQECNLGSEHLLTLTPLIVDGKIVAKLVPRSFNILKEFTDCFESSENSGPIGFLKFLPTFNTSDLRTKAVSKVTSKLRDRRVITGWRDELYPVSSAFREPPDFLLERAAVTFFGVKAYGVHVNGYVIRSPSTDLTEAMGKGNVAGSVGGEEKPRLRGREEDEEGLFQGSCKQDPIFMWVARRSKTKPTWPGMLDHIVAGGQPYNISCSANVLKECAEEAGMSDDLARLAHPVGIVSYENVDPNVGYKHDVLFCYDIQLPEDFTPTPMDGEVESFQLLPIQEVAKLVANLPDGTFKSNCCLVIVDFFIRKGLLSPDWPGYLDLVQGLRKA